MALPRTNNYREYAGIFFNYAHRRLLKEGYICLEEQSYRYPIKAATMEAVEKTALLFEKIHLREAAVLEEFETAATLLRNDRETAERIYLRMLRELFAERVSWGRLVALVSCIGLFATRYVKSEHDEETLSEFICITIGYIMGNAAKFEQLLNAQEIRWGAMEEYRQKMKRENSCWRKLIKILCVCSCCVICGVIWRRYTE